MNDRTRTGGCACGQLAVTAHGEPDRVGICHCMTCRKTTGSVLSLFAVFPQDRVIVEGRYQAWETNAGGRRCFCPDCGSRVFELCGAEIEIMGGAFDEPNAVRPTYEIWAVRREHWLPATDMLSYARGREDA